MLVHKKNWFLKFQEFCKAVVMQGIIINKIFKYGISAKKLVIPSDIKTLLVSNHEFI